MVSVEEMEILRAKVTKMESKFNRVAAFVSATAELIADQRRYLVEGEKALQTFISGLMKNEVHSEGGAQGNSVTTKPNTSSPSNPPPASTAEPHVVHVSKIPSIIDTSRPQVEDTAEPPPALISTDPGSFGPNNAQLEDTDESRPAEANNDASNSDLSSPQSENVADSPPASTIAQIKSTLVIPDEGSGDAGRLREELEVKNRRKRIPRRVRQDSKSSNQGLPSKVSQKVHDKVYTPRVRRINHESSSSSCSSTKRRFPRRDIRKPLRYGASNDDKKISETNGSYNTTDSETDESEESGTETPLPAIGLIPKPVYDDSFFDTSNDSFEIKVEDMDMPVLEPIDGNNIFQLGGGDMPSLIPKSPVQTTSRGNLQVGEGPLNKKLAPAISANNNLRKMKKSRRPDASNKKKKEGGKKSTTHICHICAQQLRSRHGLKAHIRSHSGAKPFQCNQCQAKFSQKSSLNRHIMIHNGQKNFICPACDKAFTTKYDRFIHSRVHSRKCQECPSCTKRFFDRRYFIGHVKACSTGQVNECPKCGKALTDPKYFRKHLLICKISL